MCLLQLTRLVCILLYDLTQQFVFEMASVTKLREDWDPDKQSVVHPNSVCVSRINR